MKDGDRDRDRDRDRDALFQICLLEGFMQNGKSFHVAFTLKNKEDSIG